MENWQVVNLIDACLLVLTVGLVVYSPIARAVGNRIMHGKTLPPGATQPADDTRVEALAGEVTALSGEVAALRDHLDAAQERLDFTERLLAQAREKGQLGPGNGR